MGQSSAVVSWGDQEGTAIPLQGFCFGRSLFDVKGGGKFSCLLHYIRMQLYLESSLGYLWSTCAFIWIFFLFSPLSTPPQSPSPRTLTPLLFLQYANFLVLGLCTNSHSVWILFCKCSTCALTILGPIGEFLYPKGFPNYPRYPAIIPVPQSLSPFSFL